MIINIMLLSIAQTLKLADILFFSSMPINFVGKMVYNTGFKNVTDCFIKVFYKVVVLLEYINVYQGHKNLIGKDSQ